MTMGLVDTVMQAYAFDAKTLPRNATDEQITEHHRFMNNLVHLSSLLHAVALATLRDDYDMENIMVSCQATLCCHALLSC